MDTAEPAGIAEVERNAAEMNPTAQVIQADSPITVDGDPETIRGKRVLVVEDGPTLTHGEMKYGAGVVAAKKWGAGEIVDPRPHAVGEIADTFRKYPDIGVLLPAMGYGDAQRGDLEETIRATPCDLVLVATPIDLGRIISIDQPHLRVLYELAEKDGSLIEAVEKAIASRMRTA